MNVQEKPIGSFTVDNQKQFIVPVYQRNYRWDKRNCKQLFDDLVALSQHPEQDAHFFGAIVTDTADKQGHDVLVIDGQQRITTVSLLLLAGINAVKDGKLVAENAEYMMNKVRDTFLYSQYYNAERKIKLRPIDSDREAYDRIYYNDREHFVTGSGMTTNYLYFYNTLTATPQPLTFNQLIEAVERLKIISMELGESDDAQRIFESINSTGKSLTEADKVRNHLLMSLSVDEQQQCYKEYWQKIEETADKKKDQDPTRFLRDYLTVVMQLSSPVKENDYYSDYKAYMVGRDRKAEMAQMRDYARLYQQVNEAAFPQPRLAEKMSHLCNLGSDTVGLFFLPFLSYANINSLGDDEIYRVIDIVENYLARRTVCGYPGNALTKVFCMLHRDVLRSLSEYEDSGATCAYSYADILTYHIMRRDGNAKMPDDVELREAVHSRDMYHVPPQQRIFIFERLENAVPGETTDVAEEMRAGKASIEHIMPQTLTAEWRTMLGPDYQSIAERYTHTLANLTLTGVNSALSNRPFPEKRDGFTYKGKHYMGYRNSKYRMTQCGVAQCEQWTAAEMEQRAESITQTLLMLYPLPVTEYQPQRKAVDEVSLDDDDFNPANRYLKGYTLFGETRQETVWKQMLLSVIAETTARYPDEVEAAYADSKVSYLFNDENIKEVNRPYCSETTPGHYVQTSTDSRTKLLCLRQLFEKCGIDLTELVLLLEPSNK